MKIFFMTSVSKLVQLKELSFANATIGRAIGLAIQVIMCSTCRTQSQMIGLSVFRKPQFLYSSSFAS